MFTHPSHPRLFSQGQLREFLEKRRQDLEAAIDRFDKNRLISASVDDLTGHFVSKYRLEAPALRRQDAEQDEPQEVQIDPARFGPNPNFYDSQGARIAGVRYTLHVPFDGSADLFNYQPNMYTVESPIAVVRDGWLVLTSDCQPSMQADVVKNDFNRILDDVEHWLGWVRADTQAWVAGLEGMARARLQARRQRLLSTQAAAASMGFKLRERVGAPRTYLAPDVRRKIAVAPPAPSVPLPGSAAPSVPEPTLGDADYEHIISVVTSMATVIERSPAAFKSMEEEHLRFLFLVPLNGHYEGQATGETFNFKGKTDILIRVQNRNIFIAECKFWTGPKGLTETVDQLLGYTSWRDNKTAIILFNRNKDFSKVLEQIRPVVEKHPNFKRFLGQPSESQFRFVFKQPSDAARELALTVLAFDVPQGRG